ncbi:hypothetical protein [Paenibacillus cymbidii]|uniref:hypothetical protein n=1 Tax=Paenibacillus cymbidii TaxID=1639034 RepID=UPI001081339E|nr:hypothetical protein [Paenibacillus cymbidii]
MRDETDFEGLQSKTESGQRTLKSRFLRPLDTSDELKPLLWEELALSKLIAGWIAAIPSYERKMRLGRLAYVHNRNVKCLYERIQELPGAIRDADWMPEVTREAFERLFGAADENGFLVSYTYVLGKLYARYDRLMARLDPILNAPTVDQLRIVFVEREATHEWLQEQIRFAACNSEAEALQLAEWEKYVEAVWSVYESGGLSGSPDALWPPHLVKQPAGPLPEHASLEARFPRYTNPKPQQSYSDSSMSVLHDSVKQMIYIYATELFAGETLAAIYYYVDRMPLPFYFDLARHMWDEFRHSQMGMRRLLQMGYSVEQFQWLGGPGKTDVKERFTELYSNLTMLGEACGFKKKRKSAEAFWKFGDVISAITCEFDLIDERRHIDFATRWGPELYRKADQIVSFQEMAEMARTRRLTELEAVPPEEIAKLARNFPIFCGFHTSELAYDNY